MNDRRTEIVAQLEANRQAIISFFRALPSEQLGVQVYANGAQWSVKQVLAHLVTIERSMHRLFNNILSGGPGSPKDFDIERFNRSQPKKLDPLSISELIGRFQEVRNETIAIAAGMSEADLDRRGWHVFHGHGKLERFIRWAYEHAGMHKEDVQAVLKRT